MWGLSCEIKESHHGLFERSKNKIQPLIQIGLETSWRKDSKFSFLTKLRLLLLLLPSPCYMDVGVIVKGGGIGKTYKVIVMWGVRRSSWKFLSVSVSGYIFDLHGMKYAMLPIKSQILPNYLWLNLCCPMTFGAIATGECCMGQERWVLVASVR